MIVGQQLMNERGTHFLSVTGRLKQGATIDTARREMDLIAKRLEQQYPQRQGPRGKASRR